ncbi:hypothetical protein [Chitinophaga sp.]|uniref:hypothetical protein n=1 Tax=Chitinophaga sp. TaxID=1869181 RepID=UPI0031D0A03A
MERFFAFYDHSLFENSPDRLLTGFRVFQHASVSRVAAGNGNRHLKGAWKYLHVTLKKAPSGRMALIHCK